MEAYSKHSVCQDSLDDLIVDFVRGREHVSFPELIREVEQAGWPARGDWAVTTGKNSHILFWAGLSDALYFSILRLIRTQRLYFHPSYELIYLLQGEMAPLPIATRHDHSTDHWVPVVLSSFPFRGKREGAA